MFWTQILVSFALWVSVGVYLSRRPNPVAALTRRMKRTAKVLLAAGLMVGCLAFLFIPLAYFASSKDLGNAAISLPVWVAITLCGGVFVVANTVSMAVLVTVAREVAVTESYSASSTSQDSDQ